MLSNYTSIADEYFRIKIKAKEFLKYYDNQVLDA